MKTRLRFLARALKSRFLKDPMEIQSLLRIIRPGDTAIDIGADQG